jgi:hypothetical protein
MPSLARSFVTMLLLLFSPHPGANCTISATFSPTKQGVQQGTISIIDNASSKPQVIDLLGTGT